METTTEHVESTETTETTGPARVSHLRPIVAGIASVAAGVAVIIAAMAGASASPERCQDAIRTQMVAVLSGQHPDLANPSACDAVPLDEVDRMKGEILGAAFAG